MLYQGYGGYWLVLVLGLEQFDHSNTFPFHLEKNMV